MPTIRSVPGHDPTGRSTSPSRVPIVRSRSSGPAGEYKRHTGRRHPSEWTCPARADPCVGEGAISVRCGFDAGRGRLVEACWAVIRRSWRFGAGDRPVPTGDERTKGCRILGRVIGRGSSLSADGTLHRNATKLRSLHDAGVALSDAWIFPSIPFSRVRAVPTETFVAGLDFGRRDALRSGPVPGRSGG